MSRCIACSQENCGNCCDCWCHDELFALPKQKENPTPDIAPTVLQKWNEHKHDVYGPDPGTGQLPEGTTVGTSAHGVFVAFSIGFGEEHLLQPEEVDRFIALLQTASQKCKDKP